MKISTTFPLEEEIRKGAFPLSQVALVRKQSGFIDKTAVAATLFMKKSPIPAQNINTAKAFLCCSFFNILIFPFMYNKQKAYFAFVRV